MQGKLICIKNSVWYEELAEISMWSGNVENELVLQSF